MCEEFGVGEVEVSDLLSYIVGIKERARVLEGYLKNGEDVDQLDAFDEEVVRLEADAIYLNQVLRFETDPEKREQIENAISFVNTFYHLWSSVIFYRHRLRLIDGVKTTLQSEHPAGE